MAAKQRIRKLAKRLGRKPEEIIEILHNLGETRYKSPADMLSAEVTLKVERALSLAGLVKEPPRKRVDHEPEPTAPPEPPPMPRFLKERLEAARSEAAEPAEGTDRGIEPPEPAGPEADGPAEQDEAEQAPAEQDEAEQAPAEVEPSPELEQGGNQEPPKEPNEPEDEPPPDPEALRERIRTLEEELHKVREEAQEAKALQQLAIDRLAPAEMKAHKLEEELADLKDLFQREKNTLEQQINRLEAEARKVQVTDLAEVLEARGLQGPEEFGRLLHTLLSSKLQLKFLEFLKVVEAQRFLRTLKQTVVLTSGEPSLELPEGKIPFPVQPASRCEIAGDAQIVKLAEKLVLACRDAKVKRLLVVGGTPWQRDELLKALAGRIDVRWVSPDSVKTSEQVAQEAEEVNRVVLWSGSDLPHRLGKVYSTLDRYIEIDEPGLIGFMKTLAKKLTRG